MRWNNRHGGCAARPGMRLGVETVLCWTVLLGFAVGEFGGTRDGRTIAGGSGAASAAAQAAKAKLPEGVKNAIDYIAREHDRFHKNGFVIFDDRASGGCHMFPSGWMGDLVPLNLNPEPAWVAKVFDEGWAVNPAEGATCLRIEYPMVLATRGPQMWVACAWQSPKDERGDLIPYDLSRFVVRGEAVRLVFQVRGENGGERAEFKVFSDDPTPAPTVLTKQWRQVSLPMAAGALARPIADCFVWATNNSQNPRGCVFYVDDVKIEFGPKGQKLRLAEPRFIRSYQATAKDVPDNYFRNVCFVYDQALAISALVATGHLDRAKLVADALVYASEHDRFFKDYRLRNGYMCGDLAGMGRQGPMGPTRLPGWWDFKERKWIEDAYLVGSDCGNSAWAIIGLLNYWQATGKQADSIYLKTAVRLGEWVDKNAFTTVGAGGFHGGLEGFEPAKAGASAQRKSPWKSTEHAIDLFCAYTRLAEATGTPRFRDLARHADSFVSSMWNKKEGYLFTGTTEDGVTVNAKPVPLDVQAWSVLAFRDAKRFGPAVEWADKNCRVALNAQFAGYDFDTDKDGAWWEGTSQMCVAFRFLRQDAKADGCLKALRALGVAREPKGALGGVYAASRDGLTTGFSKVWTEGAKAEPWLYYRRPHLGATCWYIFAELGWSPYWGEAVR
jgi:hypothetical protein